MSAIEYVENIQPAKAKKSSKSDSKKPSNQKWAVLSILSIPLVMTLGNSMLIPVLPVMENKIEHTLEPLLSQLTGNDLFSETF